MTEPGMDAPSDITLADLRVVTVYRTRGRSLRVAVYACGEMFVGFGVGVTFGQRHLDHEFLAREQGGIVIPHDTLTVGDELCRLPDDVDPANEADPRLLENPVTPTASTAPAVGTQHVRAYRAAGSPPRSRRIG